MQVPVAFKQLSLVFSLYMLTQADLNKAYEKKDSPLRNTVII